MNKLYAVLLSLAFITGCASGPKDSRFSVDNKENAASTGVVFGKMCEGAGMTFKGEKTSGEIIHIGGSSEFALRLPPGKYTLSSIGSASGREFTSPTPYSFEVRANETAYVGTLFLSWANVAPNYPQYCPKEVNDLIVLKKLYGQRTPTSPVLLVSNKDEAIKAVKIRYPNIDLTTAVTRLME